MQNHTYYVYFLTNRSRTLYIGITNDLRRRLAEHKARQPGAFCTKYNLDRLVYFERFSWVEEAIRREKQIKGWRREKKINLIEQRNPQWKDLASLPRMNGGSANMEGV